MRKNKNRLITFGITVVTLCVMVLAFAHDIQKGMNLGLDLRGGFEIVYEVKPLKGDDSKLDMAAVSSAVSKRVDVLGVSEPEITIEGENRIRVQLAGITDADAARKMISSTANLTFRDVNDKLLMDAKVVKEGGATVFYQEGRPAVSLKIADSDKFFEVTTKVSKMTSGNNIMVAWLDFEEGKDSYKSELAKANKGEQPKYISAASVNKGIDSDAIITGNFTVEEAQQLADLINSGALPFQMNEIYANVVSADFGADAFSSTMFAGTIGVIAIMIFMILYYRLPGIVSAISIVAYVFTVLAIYNLMGAVFTLSGIAALVLGLGMAVDSSVITFERIKDAMHCGRGVKSAFYEGTQKSFSTIFDSQLTTFISAIILYTLGRGSVKGFATMLIISVIATLIINVWFVRFLLKQLIDSEYVNDKVEWFGVKRENIPDVSKKQEQFYFGVGKTIDFVKISRYFITGSITVLIVSILFMGMNGVQGQGIFNLGIDFASGTKITITSNDSLTVEEVKDYFKKYDIKANEVKLSGEDNTIANVSIKEAIDSKKLTKIKKDIKKTYGHAANDSVVTPVIGKELVKNAVVISLLAWIGIMIYISFRFKWDYAVSGIVALVHDVFIILAFCAIFRLEINTEIIAVILAIIGYSINNSIVVFDRIRENVSKYKKNKISNEQYKEIVNDALQNTLVRSINSTITTIIPVIALLLLGSHAIFTFNFALLVGLIAGAVSSMFIAAQLWYYIRTHYTPKPKTKKKKVKKDDGPVEMTVYGIND